MLKKRKVEIAEGKFLDRQRPLTTTFDELAQAYLKYARDNKRSWDRDETSVKKLSEVFGKRLADITPASIERYKTLRRTSKTIYGHRPTPPLSTARWRASNTCSTSLAKGSLN